ncbi:MAG: response regulator [Candidatus Methanoperedens sp.]|nr:response regulator [Candidatus Methanoperedens sp.]MCZ7358846.1 response regulator [Candidatus Methanoperedens sp.]HLB69736.1 response regulator [Candidatus Methanoperedens sp.]
MKGFEILLVEDNQSFVSLMMEALKESQVPTNLSVVMDGVEAMAFVRRESKYAHSPRPDLILLDLNLPRKKGQKVLEEIKNDPDLKRIPVLIFTVSGAEQDILRSYDLHANCYIIKPKDLDRFIAVVKATMNFWFTVVKLPPGE